MNLPFDTLTEREKEVLREYLKYGHRQGIADSLGIQISTVKNMSTSAMSKLGANSTGQAAAWFALWERGWPSAWPEVERRTGRDRRIERDRRAAT